MRNAEKHRVRNRELMRTKRAAGLPAGDARHGTYAGYSTYGCRCFPCRSAQHQYYLKEKERRSAS